jgi:hypothetical protein
MENRWKVQRIDNGFWEVVSPNVYDVWCNSKRGFNISLSIYPSRMFLVVRRLIQIQYKTYSIIGIPENQYIRPLHLNLNYSQVN